MCQHRHRRTEWAPARRETAPRPPASTPDAPVRAGDADRERVIEQLRRHAAAGRLDAGELEARLDRVYAATYIHEAQAALAELPPEPVADARPRHPAQDTAWRPAAFAAAIVALIIVTSATGAWALWWLMWPIAMVLGPHRHRHHRRGAIAAWPGPLSGGPARRP
jgi:hypothetical protein